MFPVLVPRSVGYELNPLTLEKLPVPVAFTCGQPAKVLIAPVCEVV